MMNYEKALNYYNQALNWYYDEEAKCGKAKCLEKLGKADEASQLFFELGDRYTWGDEDKNILLNITKSPLIVTPIMRIH